MLPIVHSPTLRLALVAAALAGGRALEAQRPDSAGRAQPLDAVVVTAERTGAALASSSAAITRLSGDQLRRLPVQTVSAALELVPGIAVLQSDGLGDAPRLAIRGFYGGGETEYVTVLLDGVPLTELGTGRVNWDLVPLASLEAIEVVRGGASSLWGDAAVGGVVNLITRREERFATWRAFAGTQGIVRAGGATGGRVAGRRASLFGDVRRSAGFREHEERDAETVGASIALAGAGTTGGAAGRGLTLSTLHHRRVYDDAGPLTETALAADREAASPFFRFDETEERIHRVTLDGRGGAGGRRMVSGYVTGEYARGDALRTQPLSAEFADTKQRETRTTRAIGSLQLEAPGLLGTMAHRLVVGADASAGRLTSTYRNVLTGDEGAYAGATGAIGDVDARGAGTRAAAAAFANWELLPFEALRVSVGGRVDWIRDRFEPRAPSDGETHSKSRSAFSPRAGANLRWIESARQTGNLYVTAGRSFKAPTMDQLFDQRSTPVPFDPYKITTSNPLLEAQYGNGVEAGAYHRVALVPSRLDARLALSVYQMDMRDELDFDLQSFRYVNLGRSRHRGIEAGLSLAGPSATTGFLNYTQQDATTRYGDNNGNFLKAVPRRVLSAGLGRVPAAGLGLAATATHVRDIWLDDANERRLEPYTRVDLKGSYPLARVRLSVNVTNLLDREYSTTGFGDPAGSGAFLLYPAAGRVLMVGLESSW